MKKTRVGLGDLGLAVFAMLLAILCTHLVAGCIGGSKPDYFNLFPQKTPGASPPRAPDPEPMALDQKTATNQLNLDAKVNAELQARIASDEIQNRIMATQIDSLSNENAKLKVELSARDITIGDLKARLDFSVKFNESHAGRDQRINDPVIAWILAIGVIGIVPFCFFAYIILHRSNWFKKLKYGKNYRG